MRGVCNGIGRHGDLLCRSVLARRPAAVEAGAITGECFVRSMTSREAAYPPGWRLRLSCHGPRPNEPSYPAVPDLFGYRRHARVDRPSPPAIFRRLRDLRPSADVRKAPVAELVDALDSKSSSARSAGSIPARGTKTMFLRYLCASHVSGRRIAPNSHGLFTRPDLAAYRSAPATRRSRLAWSAGPPRRFRLPCVWCRRRRRP